MDQSALERLGGAFRQQFGSEPKRVVRAPGRVNLIGEHTDYSGGFVLPLAIDREALALAAPSRAPRIRVYSELFAAAAEVPCAPGSRPAASGTWTDMVWGVVWLLKESGVALAGCDVLVGGDLPVGKGLASSAAFSVTVARAVLSTSGARIDPLSLALLCRAVEHQFLGVECGIMDQFAAILSRRGSALWLDCATLAYAHIPLDESQVRVVVADSATRHVLTSGGYNARRTELGRALIAFRERTGAQSPREVSPDQLHDVPGDSREGSARRLRHVVEENQRVLESAQALLAGDLEAFGRLMLASHASLRDLFEVSTPELDALVDAAVSSPGCLGAKLTGAGFGGATVNLVRADLVERFCASLSERYRERTRLQADIFLCRSADGVSELALETL